MSLRYDNDHGSLPDSHCSLGGHYLHALTADVTGSSHNYTLLESAVDPSLSAALHLNNDDNNNNDNGSGTTTIRNVGNKPLSLIHI